MSTGAKIAHNTAIQAIGKILGLVLALLAASLTLHYLKDDGNGVYTKVTAYLQMFGIGIDLGLYIILIKRLATISFDTPERESRVVNAIVTLRVVVGAIVLSSAPVIALIISQFNDNYTPQIVIAIAATAGFYFFLSLNQLLSAIFQKFLYTAPVAIGEFLGKAVQLGGVLLVIALNGSVFWMLMTLVASSGANFLINLWFVRKFVRLRFVWDMPLFRDIAQEAWPIALSIVFTLIYFKGDTFIMTFFASDAIIGQYGAPYKILEVLVTFPAMFAGLVLPILGAAWEAHDQARFQEIFQKSFTAIALIALPLIAGVQVLAPQIMTIIAGSDFATDPGGAERVVAVLRILIVATGAIYFGTLFGYLVVSLNKQKTMLLGYAFVAASALAGYLIFIPRFSVYGAAAVTVYSETMVVLIGLTIILRTTRIRLSWYPIIGAAAAACIMYAVLRLLLPLANAWSGLPELLNALVTTGVFAVIGASVFGVTILLFRVTTLSELRSLFLRNR